MNVKIVKRQFQLVGFEAQIDLSQDSSGLIESLWKKLFENDDKITNTTAQKEWVTARFNKWGDIITYKNPTRWCFIGLAVNNLDTIPSGFSTLEFPESSYAIFDEKQRGEITGEEGYAAKAWFLKSGYKHNEMANGNFEVYSIKENVFDDHSECDIYIPIIKR